MHIKAFYTQQHCYVSLKTIYMHTLAGFKPGSSCSCVGCDAPCATPPGLVSISFLLSEPAQPKERTRQLVKKLAFFSKTKQCYYQVLSKNLQ
jgi:hypothetical protein